jgi:single-strand DNA-binding protein
MAGSLNKVTLIGNVGNDPEIRSTQNGKEIANLSIATSESWRDKATGEKKERTEWHRVVVFSEGLVNVIKNYVKKGAKLYIEGALQTRKWTDKDGVERYSTEIVLQGFDASIIMLDGKGGGNDNYSAAPNYDNYESTSKPAASSSAKPSFAHDDIDDEIPF